MALAVAEGLIDDSYDVAGHVTQGTVDLFPDVSELYNKIGVPSPLEIYEDFTDLLGDSLDDIGGVVEGVLTIGFAAMSVWGTVKIIEMQNGKKKAPEAEPEPKREPEVIIVNRETGAGIDEKGRFINELGEVVSEDDPNYRIIYED